MKRTMKKITRYIISLALCLALTLTSIQMPAYAQSGNWTGGQVDKGYRLKVVYSESAQNPKTNTSKVTATLYLVQDKGYDLYIGTRSATITINGEKTTITNIPAIRNSGNVTTKLGTATATVKHTTDGTKSITIAASFDMKATLSGSYFGTMSTSQKVTLDKLDRVAPTVTLKYSSASSNSIKLVASANVACDNWQYSLNGGSSWTTFGSSGTSNTFTISNLSGGKEYSIVARARKVSNQVVSSKSSAVTATTKPNPPGNLSVDNITTDSAKLSWGTTTGAKTYNAYLNGSVVEKGLTKQNYTFTELMANTSYKFGVSATGTSGSSSLAQTADYITLPNTPTELLVTKQSQSSVELSWEQDNGGDAAATTFNVYRDDKLIGTSSTTTYVDASYNNTDSNYMVCAVTSAGSSAKTTEVSVTHIPLTIILESSNKGSYVALTPKFQGGVNREVDEASLKWAYGSKNASYFENGGYAFTGNFAAIQNGTYTVYATDVYGNEAVETVEVSGIYTASTIGAYTSSFTDLYVDSIGIPVSFERTYNSMSESDNVFGKGWSLNYAKNTCLSENGKVRLVYLPDGSINYFSVNEDGSYSGIKTQNTLTQENDAYILTTKDHYKYIYKAGTLTSIQDANGNEIVIEINSHNLPVKIIDSANREYTIKYDRLNRIISITDPANRSVVYEYDDEGQLVSFKAVTRKTAEKYLYTNGILTTIKDGSGKATAKIAYNENNQVIKLVDEEGECTYYYYKITSNGEIVIYENEEEIVLDEMDSESNPPNNTYNTFNQLILSSDGFLYEYNSDGTVSKIDGTNSDKTLVLYSYDSNGNVTRIITKNKEEQVIEEKKYQYTYYENSCAIASEKETIISYNYNDDGEKESTETSSISYSYDKAGNLLKELSNQDSEDEAVSYTYDAKGLLLTKTESGIFVEYSYDKNGYITTEKTMEDGKSTSKTSTHNVVGNILKTTENEVSTEYLYDLFGNEIRVTQSEGDVTRVTRYIYDDNNLVIQKISSDSYLENEDSLDPDINGFCAENKYKNSNVGERYTYDTAGNVLTYINNANNKTINTYDEDGKLVKTVTYETPEASGNGLTTRYVYDSEGQLTQTIYPHQYQLKYDSLDVSNGINEYTDDSTGERTSYDENGNVVKYISSSDEETLNSYDSKGHLVKSVQGKKVTRFVYDGGDHLLQVVYPDQYNADEDNLDLEAETPVDKYSNASVGDRYQYDSNGNVVKYTNSFGIVTDNDYDSDGNLIKSKKSDGTQFSYNKKGETTNETYSNGLSNSISHKTNQTVIKGSNGITATYQKNGFREISSYHLSSDKINKKYTYQYDANGNILSISLNGEVQQSYQYNSSDELIRVNDKVAGETVTYQYDFVGNITQVKHYAYSEKTLETPIKTENYSYNEKNQRLDLSYDEKGNLTSINGFSLTWQDRRLINVKNSDNDISYTYNYEGIRTSKTVNGVTTTFKVDENNNVIEQQSGSTKLSFIYNSSGSPVCMEYNGKTYYYEKNLQGDIVGIIDEAGEVVVQYSYNEWGKVTGITGSLADTVGDVNPLRYRGYYYDTETELYYLQSRYYSADIMRFVSEDEPTYSNDQGQPLGSNLYAYCVNNPIKNSDPTGNFGSPLQWIMAAIGGVVGWYFGDFIAKKLGYSSGWKYWAIRTGVIIGGAVIGWFSAKLVASLATKFLSSSPEIVMKLSGSLGVEKFYKILSFLGVDPFKGLDSGKFVGIARNLDSKTTIYPLSWAKAFCEKARSLGFRIELHIPHEGYTYHIHLFKGTKKIQPAHIQVAKSTYDYLLKLFK